ncbi:MAG: ABC transporter permease [Actinomycetota bacterium]|nr:ABC transporter permease [Actinomycetota bacterium]
MASPAGVIEAARPLETSFRTRHQAWRRFRGHRLAVVGLVIVGVLVGLALAAPLLKRLGVIADPYALDTLHARAAPSRAHLLGTDGLGRDMLSRTIYGARVSLSVGVLVQLAALVVGGGIGVAAGYIGGRVDNLLMRFTDVMFSFPDLLFVLVIASVVGSGYWSIFIAIAAVNWVFLARLVRGEVLAVKELDYIAAARASGTRPGKVVLRHLVPNILGPVIVTMTFAIPSAIFIEAFLSFIGVGMQPPTPSWGVMVKEGYEAIFANTHQVLVPAVAISLTTLSFNFIGDGLRDALDPRIRR